MSEIYLLYITFGSEQEALFVARTLVEKHLVACANVFPSVTSIYRWEGKLDQAQEVVLTAKTSVGKLPAAIKTAKDLHSYALPCIIACPIETGFSPFIEWVKQETV